jgi:hypothetical protein
MTTETSLTDLVAEYKTNYETELNIDIPAQRRAFLNVLAVQQATCHKALEKRIAAAQKAVLAVTADADGLAVLGDEFDCPREDAVAYNATCTVPAAGGSSITAGTELSSDATGAYYKVDTTESEVGGFITFTVTAEDAGEAANLDPAPHVLKFVSPVPGITSDATIYAVVVYGSDQEELEHWRARVLEAERAAHGGGNLADYRYWSEQVSGVARAYPYSGKPISWYMTSDSLTFGAVTSTITRGISMLPLGLGTLGIGDMIKVSGSSKNDGYYTVQSVELVAGHYVIHVAELLVNESPGASVTITNASLPGDRTVYVESTDPTRIPSDNLIDQVRAAIEYGTSPAIFQPSAGDVDSTLYVEKVTVANFYIQVLNLDVDAALEDQCKAKVVTDLTAYFNACRPFITGLDFEMDRSDIVTDLTVGLIVQGVLAAFGASAGGVLISIGSAGAETFDTYQLSQCEIAELACVWDLTDPDWSA